MSKLSPPPLYEPIFEDIENAVPSNPWVLFFNGLFQGDTGTEWKPHFTGLTVNGAETITGNLYRITRALCLFTVRIVPAIGGNSSAIAGTTYIDNFPLKMFGDGACFAISGLLGSSAGQCDMDTNRVYVPAWSGVTVPLTVIGLVEAR